MTKTARDVTTEALRTLGVLAVDEEASADDHARASSHLSAIYAELDETHGLALEWTTETVPDRLWLPVSTAVAGSVAAAYGMPEKAGYRQAGIAAIMRDELGGEPERATEAQFF